MKKPKTILDIREMYENKKKIAVLTAYDYPFARIMDHAGIDIILVGDSAGNVVAGHENTLPVTMEEMIYHTRSVTRAAEHSFVVADMPFLSYQADISDARRNAGRLVKEGGAHAVKLEGGINLRQTIRAISDMDIPVVGHIGLTPQSVHRMGGYRIQGRNAEQSRKIKEASEAVQEAGAFALVLEGIPELLAGEITASLDIPTIGIGAGPLCSGQVLVAHDMLGLSQGFSPKFVKRYAELSQLMTNAFTEYITDVKEGKFPGKEHSFN